MLTEDTGTQGAHNAELELGFAWNRLDGDHALLFQPQLAYGVSAAVDLMVQPSWLMYHYVDGERQQGLGDTNLDMKWRFFGAAPWSFGVRAGVTLPTSQHQFGLPSGTVSPHVTLVATADFAPFIVDANLGYIRLPGSLEHRSDLYHFSAATLLALNERWIFLVDAALDSNPNSVRASFPEVAIVGVIYTARPGLDLDIGYRARLSADSAAEQWLLGITFRGAL